jgi:hypothetical protein
MYVTLEKAFCSYGHNTITLDKMREDASAAFNLYNPGPDYPAFHDMFMSVNKDTLPEPFSVFAMPAISIGDSISFDNYDIHRHLLEAMKYEVRDQIPWGGPDDHVKTFKFVVEVYLQRPCYKPMDYYVWGFSVWKSNQSIAFRIGKMCFWDSAIKYAPKGIK